MAFCGAMLAPSHDARVFAVDIGDSHELGFLWPGIQKKSGDQDRATYVNHLLGMAVGAVSIANGQVYFRSNHAFESLAGCLLGVQWHWQNYKSWRQQFIYVSVRDVQGLWFRSLVRG